MTKLGYLGDKPPGCELRVSLIRKGAEADLYLDYYHMLKVIKKVRKAKAYRLPQLDFEIRHLRTGREAQFLHEAKLSGVPTPFIYMVDVDASTIIIQYLEGGRIKEVLDSLPQDDRESLCKHIGTLIGRLHVSGIIHGDLTTSNIIINEERKVFFIDFGLAEYSKELEKRGVDLLLMRRSLQATHHLCAKSCFDAIIEGYSGEIGEKETREVLARIEKIAKRGRYAIDR